jgi:capsular polysaccharide transport system permease protein
MQIPTLAPPHWSQAARRSVWALVLRELASRYGRTPGGYLWALLHPLGVIVMLAYAFSLLQKTPTLGTSFLLFKATGFLIVRQFTVLGGVTGHALGYSRSLLLYPRVAWIDAVLARFLLNAVIMSGVFAVLLVGIVLYDGVETFIHWPKLVLAFALTAAMGFSLGVLNCYLFHRFEVWQQIWAILTTPLFLISGVILVFEDMPRAAQGVLWFNPLLHLTGLMRAAFYPVYRPEYISFVYVGLWCLVPLVTGMMLMHLFHRDLVARRK